MRENFFKIIFFVGFLFLVFFQLKTTNFGAAYEFTPHEIDLQIRRMNMYPPSLARVGYILEAKKESQILKKLENNFFTVVDFSEYFPNRLPFILSPFFFLGLYFFIREREKRKVLFLAFIFSLVLLTILGSHAKYGPVLIMPFFALFIILGILRVINIRRP